MKRLMTLALALAGSVLGANAQWIQTQGPEGGNASAIAHVGNATLAVMRPNALYRLADGAGRWSRIGTLAADELFVAGDVVLANTFERIARSTDGGTSWTPVGPAGSTLIRSIDGATVYATGGTGLLRSLDAGATWSPVDGNIRSIITGEYTPVGLAGSGDTLLAGESFTTGVLRSTDAGATWTVVTAGLPDSANVSLITNIDGAFYAQLTNDHIGRLVGVYRSTDGGLSWNDLNQGLPERGENRGFVFGFYEEAGRVLAATLLGSYRLEDTVWVGDGEGIVVGTAEDNAGVIYRGTFDGIHRSDDGGQTWARFDAGMLSQQITAMATSGARVIASAASGIFASEDRGASWVRTGIDRIVEFITGGGVLLGRGSHGTNVGLIRSTDGGRSWLPANDGIDRAVTGASSIASGNGALYAGFMDIISEATHPLKRRGGLYRSTDGGATWSALENGLPRDNDSSVAVITVAASGDTVIAQTFHGIHRSTDRGESWSDAGFGLPERPSIRAMHAHHGTFYLALGTTIWASTDGGASWSEMPRPEFGFRGTVNGFASFGEAVVAITGTGRSHLYMLANEQWQLFRSLPDSIEAATAVLHEGRVYAGTDANSVMRLDVNASTVEREDAATEITWTPHPLQGATASVELVLSRPAEISLELFDMTGRRVASVPAGRLGTGTHRIGLPITGLAPGAYGYRLGIDDVRRAGVVIVAE